MLDSQRQADDSQDIEITPKMIEVGVDALFEFGSCDEVRATDPSLIVQSIFRAMRFVEAQVPPQVLLQPLGQKAGAEIEVTPDMIEAGVVELRKHVSERFVLSDEEVVDLLLQSALSSRNLQT